MEINDNLESLSKRIIKNLYLVKKNITELTDENFVKKFKRIEFLNKDILKTNEKIKTLFPVNQRKEIDKNILQIAKEIKVMLDNITADKKKRSTILKKELNSINNQKNLIKYNR